MFLDLESYRDERAINTHALNMRHRSHTLTSHKPFLTLTFCLCFLQWRFFPPKLAEAKGAGSRGARGESAAVKLELSSRVRDVIDAREKNLLAGLPSSLHITTFPELILLKKKWNHVM